MIHYEASLFLLRPTSYEAASAKRIQGARDLLVVVAPAAMSVTHRGPHDGPSMLEASGQDKYTRTIADVLLPDGMNLNQKLVKDGWCWWY
jgi:hypothetical protein